MREHAIIKPINHNITHSEINNNGTTSGQENILEELELPLDVPPAPTVSATDAPEAPLQAPGEAPLAPSPTGAAPAPVPAPATPETEDTAVDNPDSVKTIDV